MPSTAHLSASPEGRTPALELDVPGGAVLAGYVASVGTTPSVAARAHEFLHPFADGSATTEATWDGDPYVVQATPDWDHVAILDHDLDGHDPSLGRVDVPPAVADLLIARFADHVAQPHDRSAVSFEIPWEPAWRTDPRHHLVRFVDDDGPVDLEVEPPLDALARWMEAAAATATDARRWASLLASEPEVDDTHGGVHLTTDGHQVRASAGTTSTVLPTLAVRRLLLAWAEKLRHPHHVGVTLHLDERDRRRPTPRSGVTSQAGGSSTPPASRQPAAWRTLLEDLPGAWEEGASSRTVERATALVAAILAALEQGEVPAARERAVELRRVGRLRHLRPPTRARAHDLVHELISARP